MPHEGKTEIWVALKAAVDAMFKDDIPLAQAILDGAGVSLPGGSLCECYDEWGTRWVGATCHGSRVHTCHVSRYSIPVYCLSNPLNLVMESDRDSPAEFSEPVPGSASSSGPAEQQEQGEELKVKVRLSTTGEDVRLVLNTVETIGMAKKKLQDQEGCQEPSRQRWYFGGKLLGELYCSKFPGHILNILTFPFLGDKNKVGDAQVPQGYVIQCIINTLDFDVITTKE